MIFTNFKCVFTQLRLFKRLYSHKLIFSNEVQVAKKNNLPIVALESTIITHGMPYPDNFNTAMRVESAVRTKGAIPATVGIIRGQIHVGMDQELIKRLAEDAKGPGGAVKCAQRDICTVVAGQMDAGTTVGGTITIAHRAGISVMATGGIGGVHRGAADTFDISSDLVVLSRTPVAVVCAGVKAILDIPKTLELLETLGVPVITIGDSWNFPAFYSSRTRDSVRSPAQVGGPRSAAGCIWAHRSVGMTSGMVFAVPLPELAALDPMEVEKFVEQALKESEERAIRGKDVTPYLLKRVTELTDGKSLEANKVLIENNAQVAAEMAVELCKLSENSNSTLSDLERGKTPVVIGGAVLDTVLQIEDPLVRPDGRTHQGRSRTSCGGVGRNVAAALTALGVETRLITVVGEDNAGRKVLESLGRAGRSVRKLSGQTTARYTGVIAATGECVLGIGEMAIFDKIERNLVRDERAQLERAPLIVLDGNPPLETMREVIDIALNQRIPVIYEPTDVKKACKIFECHPEWRKILQCVSPNIKELIAMAKYFSITNLSDLSTNLDIDTIRILTEGLVQHIPIVLTTLGPGGLIVSRRADRPFDFKLRKDSVNGKIHTQLYPPLLKRDPETLGGLNASGCGDCLTAGIIAGVLRGLSEASCVSLGLKAASISLESTQSTPETLTKLRP